MLCFLKYHLGARDYFALESRGFSALPLVTMAPAQCLLNLVPSAMDLVYLGGCRPLSQVIYGEGCGMVSKNHIP